MSKAKEKAPAKPERLIYCGPSLPGGLLQQYTIFKGGIPKHLDGAIEKCPGIKSLFVPYAKLKQVMAAEKSPGSLENLRFREVTEFIREGGLKHGI